MATPIEVRNSQAKEERAQVEKLFYSRHAKMKRDFKNLSLDEQFPAFISSVTMNDEDTRLRQRLLEDLISLLREDYKNICLFPFGSFVTGLGDKDSDLDVVADCSGNAIVARKSLEKGVKRKIFKNICRILRQRGLESNFSQVIPIPAARVPIIKFVHTPTKVHCDLSLENLLSVRNSELIHLLLELDPRVRPLMCLIRYWGRYYKLIDSMKIKNYGLILLILVFLKQKNIIPSVYQLQNWDPKPPEVRIDWWNASFYSNKEEIIKFMDREGRPPVELNQFNEPTAVSIIKLAKEFFQLYAEFPANTHVICSLTANTVPRELFFEGCEDSLPAEMKDYKVFCDNFDPITMGRRLVTESKMSFIIQDPFALCCNVSAVTSKQILDRFQCACRSTAAHLQKYLDSSKTSNVDLNLMNIFCFVKFGDLEPKKRKLRQNLDEVQQKSRRLENTKEADPLESNDLQKNIMAYVDSQLKIKHEASTSSQAGSNTFSDDHGFVEGGSAVAPPFQDFLAGNGVRLYTFKAIGAKEKDYCFVQNMACLHQLDELETAMSTWYNEYYFKNEIWKTKNWHKVSMHGYYAAWIESKSRWVRAFACKRVYSENGTERSIGKYKVVVFMLDYGILATVERFHLVPMRSEFLALPVVASMGSLQSKLNGNLTRELCGTEFNAFVLEQKRVDGTPYRKLKLLIARRGEEAVQLERLKMLRPSFNITGESSQLSHPEHGDDGILSHQKAPFQPQL